MVYSCVEGGLTGTGNISSDPLFINLPTAGYCFLSQIAAGQASNSPCVNAGDPASQMIPGSTRTDMVLDNGIVDMGFHWVQSLLDCAPDLDLRDSLIPIQSGAPTQPQSHCLNISNCPNPFNPVTTIELRLEHASLVNLTVCDITGRVVAKLCQRALEAGIHKIEFDGANLPSGTYVYHVEADGKASSGKAVLLK